MMLWKVVSKELREFRRDRRRFASVAVVPAVLIGVVAWSGFESHRLGNVQRKAETAARENWGNQGHRDPHGAAHHGTFLFKSQPPLAVFDPGLDPYLGTTVRIEAHRQHRLANRPAAAATDALRFEASTAALVLQVVLPLALILLGFSAVSGEREQGTLPLVLSLGIPSRTLILGKSIAILTVVGVLITPVALVCGWAFAPAEAGASSSDLMARAGLLALGYAAYLGGWTFFTLAASARARSSKLALIALLTVWAASTWLVPRLATESAQRLHPLPTQEEIEQQTKNAARSNARGENPHQVMLKEFEATYLSKYQVKRKEDLPINFEGIMLQASEEFTNTIQDTANASLETIFERQDRLIRSCTLASPFLAIRIASMALAGTDRLHHNRFEQSAEAYRRKLVRTMNEALAQRKPAHPAKANHLAGRDLWVSLETFQYRMPGWTWAARQSAPSLILLSGWIALSAGPAVIWMRVGREFEALPGPQGRTAGPAVLLIEAGPIKECTNWGSTLFLATFLDEFYAMLEAIDLTKRYEKHLALDQLNLTIEPGEVFCLLGANGAGKSTTINLFLNFIAPSAGTVRVKGLDVVENPLVTKRFLAYIPEQVMLYKNLTGLENLEYFATLAGKAPCSHKQSLEYLSRSGLPAEAAQRRVATYSKGMRQKVGIAIALAKEAEALLLDEPTSGLDPKASNEFSGLLDQLSQAGVAVLMATHDLFRAKESGTRVGIMKRGRLVETLRTDEIGHADLEQLYLQHMHD